MVSDVVLPGPCVKSGMSGEAAPRDFVDEVASWNLGGSASIPVLARFEDEVDWSERRSSDGEIDFVVEGPAEWSSD